MVQNKTVNEIYHQRINIVVEHINNNLDREIDLASLAEMSHFSPYHFHHLFKGIIGEPVRAFIVRMRVETAARLIRYSSLPIEEICYKVGYNVPSSLTKVFKQHYSISPIEFRNNKNYTIMKPVKMNVNLDIKEPKIQHVKPKKAIYIRKTGDYSKLDFSETWEKLWQFVKKKKLFSLGMEHVAIYHNDPKMTDVDKLLTDLCLVIAKPVEPEGEIGVKEISGGEYAVFTYTGSYEYMSEVYDCIYGKWLLESGYELSEGTCYELYLNNPHDTKPEKLKTKIYLPVKKN